MNCPNQITMLELITILSLITLSLSWIQDYPDQITIATDNRLSQTDKRLSVSDNNIKYIIEITGISIWSSGEEISGSESEVVERAHLELVGFESPCQGKLRPSVQYQC